MDNRQKLHQMIDSISSDGTLSYLETFIQCVVKPLALAMGI